MEPFSPQDPLSKLLSNARPVEPRPNFTANVLRAIRQEPQRESFWVRLSQRWLTPQPALALGAVAVAASLVTLLAMHPWSAHSLRGNTGQLSGMGGAMGANRVSKFSPPVPSENEVAAEWDGMNELGELLVQRDPSTMSDSDIAALLY